MPQLTGDHPLRPIVVVDDDHNDTYFLLHRLEQAGVANPVLTFASGAAAIDFLARLPAGDSSNATPCLVFVDAKMPGMSGFDVLQQLRKQHRLSGVPVFLLSGSENPQHVEQALALGADHFLPKHPVADALARTVGGVTGIRFK